MRLYSNNTLSVEMPSSLLQETATTNPCQTVTRAALQTPHHAKASIAEKRGD